MLTFSSEMLRRLARPCCSLCGQKGDKKIFEKAAVTTFLTTISQTLGRGWPSWRRPSSSPPPAPGSAPSLSSRPPCPLSPPCPCPLRSSPSNPQPTSLSLSGSVFVRPSLLTSFSRLKHLSYDRVIRQLCTKKKNLPRNSLF